LVYGTLMKDEPALAALGDTVHGAPCQAPPRAPALSRKARNGSCPISPTPLPRERIESNLVQEPRHEKGKSRLCRGDPRGRTEGVTPDFGASATGQINASFPVTPQNGAAIPAQQA